MGQRLPEASAGPRLDRVTTSVYAHRQAGAVGREGGAQAGRKSIGAVRDLPRRVPPASQTLIIHRTDHSRRWPGAARRRIGDGHGGFQVGPPGGGGRLGAAAEVTPLEAPAVLFLVRGGAVPVEEVVQDEDVAAVAEGLGGGPQVGGVLGPAGAASLFRCTWFRSRSARSKVRRNWAECQGGGERDGDGQQQGGRQRRHGRGCRQRPGAAGARPRAAGPDRLAGQEAAQVVGQVRRRGVALAGLLLQALQADRLQVARHLRLQTAAAAPARRAITCGACRRSWPPGTAAGRSAARRGSPPGRRRRPAGRPASSCPAACSGAM